MFLYIKQGIRPAALLALLVWFGFAAMHAAVAQDSPQPLSYSSAVDNYPDASEVPPIDWRAANAVVEQRGGWRAYAAEAAETAKRASQGGAQ